MPVKKSRLIDLTAIVTWSIVYTVQVWSIWTLRRFPGGLTNRVRNLINMFTITSFPNLAKFNHFWAAFEPQSTTVNLIKYNCKTEPRFGSFTNRLWSKMAIFGNFWFDFGSFLNNLFIGFYLEMDILRLNWITE